MAITLNYKKDDILEDYAVGMLKDFYLRGNGLRDIVDPQRRT